jgi:RNA polymerase sigma factor (TIGR02999 family)
VNEVTQILAAIEQGDPRAGDELLPLVDQELRRLAAHKMANEAPGQTLQPTALVHEAWLGLAGPSQQTWQNRAHFSGAAAEVMRRILIDTGRRKRALRHGGGQQRVDIQEVEIADTKQADDLLALNDALEKLAEEDSQKAELVKLRYFAGLTTVEAAAMLHVSIPTADHWWAYSRTWLFGEVRRLLAADR